MNRRKGEWFRTSDDPKTAVITGKTFEAKEITYSDLDGLAVFEGDIVLGTSQFVAGSALLPMGVVVSGDQYRWPEASVAYQIDPAIGHRDVIEAAIEHWRQKTRIRFVERTGANANELEDYLSFEDHGACWSYVGRQGGKQVVSISPLCGFGATVHEIGHAVGLWHEQSREDRDSHIRVHWENILEEHRHNFDQHVTDGDDVGGYDYGSIMHYGPYAFTRNGSVTIEPLQAEVSIGQRDGLSSGDLEAVAAIYPD